MLAFDVKKLTAKPATAFWAYWSSIIYKSLQQKNSLWSPIRLTAQGWLLPQVFLANLTSSVKADVALRAICLSGSWLSSSLLGGKLKYFRSAEQ